MTNNEVSIFCNNVKILREHHKISKLQMAKICHISILELMEIEHGVLPKNIKADIIVYIYKYFNISPENLFRPLGKI